MSCMMIDEDGMHRVVSAVLWAAKNGCPVPMSLLLPSETVAAQLWQMNAEAHADCYEDRHAECRILPDDYRFRLSNAEEIQLLKSLQFYLYQCSEGETASSPLYKDMDGICLWFERRAGFDREADTWEAARAGTRKPWSDPRQHTAWIRAEWA
jgi:hypothetical protein